MLINIKLFLEYEFFIKDFVNENMLINIKLFLEYEFFIKDFVNENY